MLSKYKLVEVNSINKIDNPSGIAYDLEVEEDHSYNVQGIVVHNSACTTRIKTGVGVPQLSAIIECSDVAHNLGAHIIADGGCTCPGDVSKALASGADLVMLGGMLAGHDEGGGQIIEEEGQKYVSFYGMSSDTAMSKHHGGVASYRTSEGRTVKIPYKGSVENTINDILGGVRSTCTYVNARTIRELKLNTTFVRVSQQFNSIFVG